MSATHSWPSLKPEKSNLPAVAEVSGAVTTFCGSHKGAMRPKGTSECDQSDESQRVHAIPAQHGGLSWGGAAHAQRAERSQERELALK